MTSSQSSGSDAHLAAPARSPLGELTAAILAMARGKRLSIVTAESCTAGKLAVLLSEAPGAAEHFQGGFVTYTKSNKTFALGVPSELLSRRGSVCREVAAAMVEGALARTPADLAVAITGVAGPDPDEDGNPVGLVCIAAARKGWKPTTVEQFYGKAARVQIQEWAMADALALLIAEAK